MISIVQQDLSTVIQLNFPSKSVPKIDMAWDQKKVGWLSQKINDCWLFLIFVVADIYVDHSFIFLHVCLLLMMLVMVCCIVGPNGAAKQQDFSYKLMIHGRCRAVANCPLVCPTLTLSVTKMKRKISFFYQKFIFLCPAIQKWGRCLLPTLKKWIRYLVDF